MGSSGDRPRQVDNSLNSCQMSNIPVPIKGPAYLRAVEASSKILALVMFLFYFENRKVSFFPHVIIFCSLTACALEKTCMRTPWESSGLLTKSSKQSKPFFKSLLSALITITPVLTWLNNLRFNSKMFLLLSALSTLFGSSWITELLILWRSCTSHLVCVHMWQF